MELAPFSKHPMLEETYLYQAPSTVVEEAAVKTWLEAKTETPVRIRPRLLAGYDECSEVVSGFASARVLSPYRRETGNQMEGILRYERRAIASPDRAGGVLYDGQQLQTVLRSLLPEKERTLDRLHLILLDRPIATWGEHDGRWHKRISILGQPTLISIPGLYEAPAKPRAYYENKQRHAMAYGSTPPREVLESASEGAFLVEDDPRTTEVLVGYLLQAYHYRATGEAFCDSSTCRLFNAHRHPDMLEAQLGSPEFCDRHQDRYGMA